MNSGRSNSTIIWVFLLPGLLIYTVFLAFPIFNSLRLSLFTGNLFQATKFVGFANYIKLFTQEPWNRRLLGALLNNVEFFLILVVVQNITALLLALILTRSLKGVRFFRSLFFIPATLSVLVVGFLFSLILNPVWGIFDKFLNFIGLGALIVPWLGNKITALPAISVATAWQYIGIPLVLFTAGLNNISQDILEAATVDGVRPFQRFRLIILPLLKPVIGVVLVLTFVNNFTAFDQVYAMATTNGNPSYATDIFGTFFYRTSFGRGAVSFNPDMGLGASIASVMFVIILSGVLLFMKFFSRKEEL